MVYSDCLKEIKSPSPAEIRVKAMSDYRLNRSVISLISGGKEGEEKNLLAQLDVTRCNNHNNLIMSTFFRPF